MWVRFYTQSRSRTALFATMLQPATKLAELTRATDREGNAPPYDYM